MPGVRDVVRNFVVVTVDGVGHSESPGHSNDGEATRLYDERIW